MINKRFLIIAALCLLASSLFAQVDTIRLQDKRLNTTLLKPGLKQYLVYFQLSASKKSLRFWLWLRDIKKTQRDGAKVFTVTQNWYGNDSTVYRHVYSVNREIDFAPIYHEENSGNKINAYNWTAKEISGADTVAGNVRKDFTLAFTQPNFNWNLDIETFEMLPLAADKAFAINFYDAGSGLPRYALYTVSGSEVLKTLDNKEVDCWKLVTEGSNAGKSYRQVFWISKKSHEFLKEEDSMDGMYRYKIKLSGAAPDIVSKFSGK